VTPAQLAETPSVAGAKISASPAQLDTLRTAIEELT
jgi:hypothetical protein